MSAATYLHPYESGDDILWHLGILALMEPRQIFKAVLRVVPVEISSCEMPVSDQQIAFSQCFEHRSQQRIFVVTVASQPIIDHSHRFGKTKANQSDKRIFSVAVITFGDAELFAKLWLIGDRQACTVSVHYPMRSPASQRFGILLCLLRQKNPRARSRQLSCAKP